MRCCSIVLCLVLLQHNRCAASDWNSEEGYRASDSKDVVSDSDRHQTYHHKLRHKQLPPLLRAAFNFEDDEVSTGDDIGTTKAPQLTNSQRIKYRKAPRMHRKQRKHFLLNTPMEDENVTKVSYPTANKDLENLMNIQLDVTITNGDEKAMAKERILQDKSRTLCRRRRYTEPYRYGRRYDRYDYYSNMQQYVSCGGWSTYEPHRCVSDCGALCQNPCVRYPKPTYSPVSIYKGSGKDWYGPKYGCNCNPKGSELTTCDIKTGHCRCKLHYVGRTCDKCENGYWESTGGCSKCDCNIEGSRSQACEQFTGRCYCKEGVGGDKCNICAKGYYGFSKDGCKQCEDCNKPGHICDQKTGRCICPPNSHGVHCEKCLTNTWGHEPQIGCKRCNCSKFGTKKQECDLKTGQCFCDAAYSGQNCEKCAAGYYGYPKCRPCNCDKAGTRCSNNVCQCDEFGQCPCKKNVIARACNKCKEGTFGLDISNPSGCTECFCFDRSKKCTNAQYSWDQIPSNQMISETLFRKRSSLYWRLPQAFRGDRLLSYNGYLRFKIENKSNSLSRGRSGPLIILEGNRMEIYRYALITQIAEKHEIQLQEELWRTPSNNKVSRMDFMVLLQNVTDIYIKAPSDNSILVSVTLDTASEVKGSLYRPAIGVEQCECPNQYTSTSCQTPSQGYCKKKVPFYPPAFGKINIDSIIGRSVPCECNARSATCDSETCECQNCTDNTSGFKCEKCAEGFWGSPGEKCQPCPCPSTDRNFAISCNVHLSICVCKPGYVGPKCEKCGIGYYGNPLTKEGCVACNCNPDGIERFGCDHSGQCSCKNGITGKQCSMCEKPRHILQNNICIPCDDCTQKLLDQVDELQSILYNNTSHLLDGKLEPPWEILEDFEELFSKLKGRFTDHIAANNKAKKIIKQAHLDNYYNEVEKITKDTNMKKLRLDVLIKNIIDTKNKTLKATADIDNIKQNLEEYTNYLKDFGKSHVSTREAVREGKSILREMRKQYEKVQNMNSSSIIKRCTALHNFLDTINKNNTTHGVVVLNSNLNDANEFLDAVNQLVSNTSRTIRQAESKNNANEKILAKLQDKLEQGNTRKLSVDAELKTVNENIRNANKALNETKIMMTMTKDEGLKDLVKDLKERQKTLKSNINELEDKLKKSINHTQMLEENVEIMKEIFKKDDKQVNAVEASDVYSNIVNLIEEARRIVLEGNAALKDLKEKIEPIGMDSLGDEVYINHANSTQLESRILNILNRKSQAIKDAVTKIESRLNEIKNTNWDNGMKDRELNSLMERLLQEYNAVDVKGLINNAMDVSDRMKDVMKQADEFKLPITYELMKKVEMVKRLTSPKETEEIREKIRLAKTHLQNVLKTEIKFNDTYGMFKLENKDLTRKLDELKAKIKKAKEISNGIRVSMSGQSCARSYRLNNLEPSLITYIKVRLSLNSSHEGRDHSLFYLPNNEGQYINLVVTKNKKISFTIKLNVEYTIDQALNTTKENHNLIVERIFDMVKLTVDGEMAKPKYIRDGNIPFNINPGNLIYVGNASNVQGLPGCIHDITFNDKKIGLWEFEQTEQCQGCSRSISDQANQIYRFNGEGFSIIKENKDSKKLNPSRFDFNFWFKTFDENALLVLSPHHESGSYMALTLRDGHVRYEMHYNGDEIRPVVLETEKKYNDGRKHYVEVGKIFENNMETSLLKLGNESKTASIKISKKQLLKVRKTNFYVGGVPLGYFIESNNSTGTLHTHASFLGDIENFKLTQNIMLHETSMMQHQSGVQLTNKPSLEFRKILCEGTGYLQLKNQTFQDAFSLIFIIRTTDNRSKIMDVGDLVSFTMNDGLLNVQIGSENLTSNGKLNNDEYHLVELKRKSSTAKSQTYVLKIDGIKVDKREVSLDTSADSRNATSEAIYIGGVPEITEPTYYFNGEISDVFINNTLIKFDVDTIDSFKNVKIGHSKPKKLLREEDGIVKQNLRSGMLMDNENPKDQQSTEGCDRSANNSLESNAAKFGDGPESYVKYYLKKQFWKEDFSIELDFRTFYKNGMLLYTQSDAKHYNLIELKEGSVLFHIVGKRKKHFNLSRGLDDGEWHTLIIENKTQKRKRKLTVTIDGRKHKPEKIPQNKVSGDVFIGGIPNSVQHKLPKKLISKIPPFKGCIKELKINKAPQSFLHHNQIGLCFSNIERGSYFRGDAYVVYKRDFKVTTLLELKFEFRTREQNGILMSVSTINNSPALSLELQNGAVVMSVDMGNGVVSNVTNFHSAYALCDNRWHNVTALFSTELTVNVDGVSKSWVISEMGLVDEIDDPLYIGGLPDNAPTGTLKIKENFKGCLRNLRIGDTDIDWIDMEELTNVSLNSCPVA